MSIDATTNDPHNAEYLAAVAGMHEHTISPPTTRLVDGRLLNSYAVGDRIAFRFADQTLYGVVVEVLTEQTYHVRRHVPDVGNEHYAVDVDQILEW